MDYRAKGSITEAQANDWLRQIAADLRLSDQLETVATTTLSFADTLTRSWAVSDLGWIGLHDGQPVVVFGLAGSVCWMLGSTAIETGPAALAVARDTARFQTVMLEHVPAIHNWIDLRNSKTMRWLLWAGFKVVGINIHYGLEQRPFALMVKS